MEVAVITLFATAAAGNSGHRSFEQARNICTRYSLRMGIVRKTARSVFALIAMLFIGLSLLGMLGVWLVDRKAAEIVLKGFGLVEGAVGVVETGVTRVHDLIATSRAETRQAAGTVNEVGGQVPANRAVLNALNDRLEANLAPRIAQIQQALMPVRYALGTISNAVSLLNSLPTMADRAPRLAALDEAFQRLEGLAADTAQFRATLRGLVQEQRNEVSPETLTVLNGIAQRIDTRLGEVQANVHELQTDIAELQARLDVRRTRLIFIFNLVALGLTLMLAWIVYSQVVLIRESRRQSDGG